MSDTVTCTKVDPLYIRQNGVYVQEIDRTDLPLGFIPSVKHLVTIPAGEVSANHKHPRSEAFIGIGDNLEFYWVDENGITQTRLMNQDNQLYIFVVKPNVPHAIRNNSSSPAVLLEYADTPQNSNDVIELSVV